MKHFSDGIVVAKSICCRKKSINDDIVAERETCRRKKLCISITCGFHSLSIFYRKHTQTHTNQPPPLSSVVINLITFLLYIYFMGLPQKAKTSEYPIS